MKRIPVAVLLAFTLSASATTITINQDAPGLLDFSVEWGPVVAYYGAYAVGPDGSNIYWDYLNRDRNFRFMEIHMDNLPVFGISVHFGPFTESYAEANQAQTAFGSPNIGYSFMSAIPTVVLPLPNGSPYGARFIYGTPDDGPAWLLMATGLGGLVFYGRARKL